MKKIIFKTCIAFLLLFIMTPGCDDDERDTLCYKGKVVALNKGDGCSNIIEIVKTINNSELRVGATITFDPALYGKELNEGDVIYFKITQYEEWEGPSNAMCLWPQFTAQIEFCDI